MVSGAEPDKKTEAKTPVFLFLISDHRSPISLLSSQLRLHFLECSNELVEVLGVEHDGRLLTAAGLLGDLEELAVSGLLQVDIERALAGVDCDRVNIIRKRTVTAAKATTVVRSCCGHRRCHGLIVLGHATCQF